MFRDLPPLTGLMVGNAAWSILASMLIVTILILVPRVSNGTAITREQRLSRFLAKVSLIGVYFLLFPGVLAWIRFQHPLFAGVRDLALADWALTQVPWILGAMALGSVARDGKEIVIAIAVLAAGIALGYALEGALRRLWSSAFYFAQGKECRGVLFGVLATAISLAIVAVSLLTSHRRLALGLFLFWSGLAPLAAIIPIPNVLRHLSDLPKAPLDLAETRLSLHHQWMDPKQFGDVNLPGVQHRGLGTEARLLIENPPPGLWTVYLEDPRVTYPDGFVLRDVRLAGQERPSAGGLRANHCPRETSGAFSSGPDDSGLSGGLPPSTMRFAWRCDPSSLIFTAGSRGGFWRGAWAGPWIGTLA